MSCAFGALPGKAVRSLVEETHAHVLVGLLLLFLGLLGGSGLGSGASSGTSGRSSGGGASSAEGKQKLLEVLALNGLGKDVSPDLLLVCCSCY